MESNSYWRRVLKTRLGRRRALAGAASLGFGAAALSVVGCGGDGGKKEGEKEARGPSGQATRGGVSRGIFLGALDFSTVDLHRERNNPTHWIAGYVQSKVLRYKNPDSGELEADLADSWEAVDAANYVFKIRNDVKWQDTPDTKGRQLTAEDIKWSWERQIAGKLKDGSTGDFARGSFYKQITKVETPDQFTVRATLERPNATFLNGISAFTESIPNREATEKYGEGDPKTRNELAMPATGPFILKQWRADKEVVFARNPNYFNKNEPIMDGIIVPLLFGDPAAARIAYEQKQIDAWAGPDNNSTKAVLDQYKGQMWEVLTGVSNTVYFHLNMNQQFKDVRLVQAANLAIDRRSLIQSFHQGLGQVSGPVTWLQEGYAIPQAELIQMDGYRVNRDEENKKARDLWAAANGASLGEINVAVIQDWLNVYPDTITIVPNMLNTNLGVRQFVSRRGTYEDVTSNLANGTFPNWFAWTSAVSGPDPRQGLRSGYHSTSTTNYQKVKNPDLDSLTDKALQETDYKKGVDLVRQIQKILVDNAQYGNINLYNYIYRAGGWNYYHGLFKVQPSKDKPGEGYNFTGTGHLVAREAWIDPKDATFQGRPPATV